MNKLSSASLQGALAGLLYGLAEYAAVVLEPMLRWGPRSLGPEHWFWEILLLSLYMILGASAGGAAAVLLPKMPAEGIPRAVAAAGLAVLVAGRLFSIGTRPGDLLLDLALALIAALAVAALFRATSRWIMWMSSPWVSIPLAFACIKLASRAGGAFAASIGMIAVWTAAAVVVWAASRTSALRKALDHRFVPLTAAALVLLVPGMAGLSLRLGADPPLPALPGAAATGRPNILLIVLDTVRADHFSLYGYSRPTTPNLTALAAESVLYRNAVSAADMTLSSYGSMYTSLYPSWHGALPAFQGSRITGLDASLTTLAETLSQSGYRSLAVLANSGYLGREFGMQKGFQYYDVRPPVQLGGTDYYLRDALRPVLELAIATREFDRIYRRADQITNAGLRVFGSLGDRNAPFFLSLNYMDAHEPLLPPRLYRNLFAPGPQFDLHRLREIRKDLSAHRRTPRTQASLTDYINHYDAALAFMDVEVKRLLDGLKRAGLYDKTLIIVTSDHGEALGERDGLNHPASVHQESIRVPLIIKYPRSSGAPAGVQVEATVSGVDLMPTVLDVVGIPIPAALQGHSLRHANDIEATVISESLTDPLQTRMADRPARTQRALYWGPWKFIDSSSRQKELYHWPTDPTESRDVYAVEQAIAAQLDQRLQDWVKLVPRIKAPAKKLDHQTRERLRGLGYVQ